MIYSRGTYDLHLMQPPRKMPLILASANCFYMVNAEVQGLWVNTAVLPGSSGMMPELT